MKQIHWKKSISLLLISSQMGISLSALASTSPSSPSPELQLVSGVLALQGEKLSADQSQAQLRNLMSAYTATATPEGEPQRLQQALIDLHVYTPTQASEFVAQSETAAAKVSNDSSSSSSSSNAQRQEAISSALTTVASLAPQGAQFSFFCDVRQNVMFVTLGAGIIVEATGILMYGADESDAKPSTYDITHDKTWMYTGGALIVAGVIAAAIHGSCND